MRGVMRAALLAVAAFAAFSSSGDGLPKVVVKPMGRVIRLGTSGNYHYERMDCVASFWAWDTAGGVVPPTDSDEYRRVFEEYAEYLDADVDFRVTFDRPVAAGSIILYGYIDTDYRSQSWTPAADIIEIARGYWNNVSVPALDAGDPMYVIQRIPGLGSKTLNYGHMTFDAIFHLPKNISLLEGIQRLNCALKNASPANIGTTVHVQCVITVGGERRSIGGLKHKIIDDPDTNWFNAHVPRYETTADLASTNAVGGRWEMASGDPVGQSSEVTAPGVLSVDTDIDDVLLFTVDTASGMSNVVTRLEADVIPECVNEIDGIAVPFSQHAGGLTLATDGVRTNWYCVALDGGTNAVVRMTFSDGSDAVYSPDLPVHVTETFVRTDRDASLASYSVDGRPLYYGGSRFVRVAVGDVSALGFVNEGRVYGVYGGASARAVGGTSMKVK